MNKRPAALKKHVVRNGDNHGVGWYGSGKLFAGVNVDGPVIYGYDAGGNLATFTDLSDVPKPADQQELMGACPW